MKIAKNQKFLTLYGSYQELIVGLFEGTTCVVSSYMENQRLSSYLLVAVQEVLEKASWQLSDLDFIAVDQGPGSFNSLRAMLATLNGVAYASGIPLIGCDGLLVLADVLAARERAQSAFLHVALLNAYNNELYYRIEQVSPDGARLLVCQPGYATLEEVAEKIEQARSTQEPLVYLGNGYPLLVQQRPDLAGMCVVPSSLEILSALARQGTVRAEAGEGCSSLQALYLKVPNYKKVS